jgi:CTP synthase (UTP-ammonia lyase)
MAARIALVGDYNPDVPAHQGIPRALEFAAQACAAQIAWDWVGTATLAPDVTLQLERYDAIWCIPASPYANAEGALSAIRFARETERPFLGTCGGFQHAVIEYARNALGLWQAEHGESNPEAEFQLITPLACSLINETAAIELVPGTQLQQIYGAHQTVEGYQCRFGVNPQFERQIFNATLRVAGRDGNGEARAAELVDHPFFIATLFQPERVALTGRAHPLINAFAAAALQRSIAGRQAQPA